MGEKKTWDDPELLLDQWYKYEQIAMHFNDLLMRFRTQALGGLTAVGTLATVFVSAKGLAVSFLPVFFAVLGFLWGAAWLLDARYYSRLLKGAVKEIRALETLTSDATLPAGGPRLRIGLSTTIDKTTTGRWADNVNAFYGLVLFALVVLCLLTAREARAVAHTGPAPLATPVTFTVDAYPSDAGMMRLTPSPQP